MSNDRKMQGIIISIDSFLLKNKTSIFEYLFNPIYTIPSNYFWAKIIGDNMNIPISWVHDKDESKDDPRINLIYSEYIKKKNVQFPDSTEDDDSECAAIVDTEYIKKYSKYFADDWSEIYVFNANAQGCEDALLSYLTSLHKDDYIDRFVGSGIDFIFHNYDGIFWEFYSSDLNYLNIIISHIKSFDTIRYGMIKFPGTMNFNLSNGKYLDNIEWIK